MYCRRVTSPGRHQVQDKIGRCAQHFQQKLLFYDHHKIAGAVKKCPQKTAMAGKIFQKEFFFIDLQQYSFLCLFSDSLCFQDIPHGSDCKEESDCVSSGKSKSKEIKNLCKGIRARIL
jgi:hypothetical protein